MMFINDAAAACVIVFTAYHKCAKPAELPVALLVGFHAPMRQCVTAEHCFSMLALPTAKLSDYILLHSHLSVSYTVSY